MDKESRRCRARVPAPSKRSIWKVTRLADQGQASIIAADVTALAVTGHDVLGSGCDLKKGVLGLCVLALLARADSYAYEIASRLSDAIDMGEGTIYPLMRRMQTDGLVETYLVESPSGPSRKYYRLTQAGRAALDAQTAEWKAFTRAVDAVVSDSPVAAAQPGDAL